MDNFLSINDAVNKYVTGCKAKVETPLGSLFIKAILAGIMIAMGAAGSSVAAHSIGNVGASRLAAAVVFPVGLMMVILTGAELFTGDCLVVMGTVSENHRLCRLLRLLSIVYIGNFIGAGLIACGVYFSGQLGYSGGLLGAYTIKVALGKATVGFGTGVVSGILCNILVCFAVIMAICAKDITGKLLSSFFVIFLFVVSGFEHCVANMYYITAGLLAKLNPSFVKTASDVYGITAEKLSELNWGNFLLGNLLPVTIGNTIGGMVFVGIPLVIICKNRKERAGV